MFLNLELWDEEPRHDNRPIIVGSGVDASLDMKTMKARIRPVNVFTIISFEHIRIYTNGRPGTSSTHGPLDGAGELRGQHGAGQ